MKWTVLFLFVFASCSSGREAVMPFVNFGYSGKKLLPVKTSTGEYSFRIWINNSTSIDRVISISKDTLEDFSGYLTEIGVLISGKKSSNIIGKLKSDLKAGLKYSKIS
ncbi:MAG TPA: hypothetical protein VIH86_08085 [Puia sp.]|jgi:hypothetical protein